MRRRRLLAVIAGGAVLLLTPVMAGAAPLTSAQIYKPIGFFRFCAEAQVTVANINESVMSTQGISIGGTIYESYTDFVASKSSVSIASSRILTVTWIDYFDVAKTQPRVIRCKLRTGESISQGAWPNGSVNNGGRFDVDPYFGFGAQGVGVSTSPTDQSCAAVNQNTINAVWGGLSPAEQAAAPYKPTNSTLTTKPDIVETTGPTWLTDLPPLVLETGVLKAQSRALIANTGVSGTARFEGAHYCTLVPPQYLRDVLLGTVTVT